MFPLLLVEDNMYTVFSKCFEMVDGPKGRLYFFKIGRAIKKGYVVWRIFLEAIEGSKGQEEQC